ncbi:MAG: triose-phosphate isomerase [Planctomycetes bacterium]|nr:triose-phosphate isomerase [Planctomycetota bacterium]
MGRKTIIVGNWKMNKNLAESRDFARELRQKLRTLPEGVEAGISPTLLAVGVAIEEMSGSDILVGAQEGYAVESGAFTGKVSMKMLKEAKAGKNQKNCEV